MGQGFRINVYNNTEHTVLVQSDSPTCLSAYKPIHQVVLPGQFLAQEPIYYEIDAGAGGFVLNISTPWGAAGFINLLLDENGAEAFTPGTPQVATFAPAKTRRGTYIFPFIALGVWGSRTLGTINLVEVTGPVVQKPQVLPESHGHWLSGH